MGKFFDLMGQMKS